jgi:hypothetical protein
VPSPYRKVEANENVSCLRKSQHYQNGAVSNKLTDVEMRRVCLRMTLNLLSVVERDLGLIISIHKFTTPQKMGSTKVRGTLYLIYGCDNKT